jgi:ribosomal protein S18 acetylase RimI-like enzyme
MTAEETAPPPIEIRRLESADESRQCARMMAGSEPWITLKRGYEESLALLEDPSREVYGAFEEGRVRGFVILNMAGALVGYVQTVCVGIEDRSRGIGRRLMRFAEERIYRESPNVFLCVSSFNPRARVLYEKLGYEMVGELKDYIVRGHSEYLLRKTIAPLREFRKETSGAPSPAPPGRRKG